MSRERVNRIVTDLERRPNLNDTEAIASAPWKVVDAEEQSVPG